MKQAYISATDLQNGSVILNGIEISVSGSTAVKISFPTDNIDVQSFVGGAIMVQNFHGKETELELTVPTATSDFDILMEFFRSKTTLTGSFTRLLGVNNADGTGVTRQVVYSLVFGAVKNWTEGGFISTGDETNAVSTWKLKFASCDVNTQSLS